MVIVTKVIEWDMGHRVPNHKNKCRNLHGHRYRLEVSVQGDLCAEAGSSNEGMVFDFGDLKELLRQCISEQLDHVCMYYAEDSLLREFFAAHPEQLVAIAVPFIPTAENIVRWCYEQLKAVLPPHLKITRCILYETPNSWAEYTEQT